MKILQAKQKNSGSYPYVTLTVVELHKSIFLSVCWCGLK